MPVLGPVEAAPVLAAHGVGLEKSVDEGLGLGNEAPVKDRPARGRIP